MFDFPSTKELLGVLIIIIFFSWGIGLAMGYLLH